MKNFASVFNQYLKEVPRSVFNSCVNKYKGDYRVRTFKCWSQFGVMLYAQLTGKVSLRDTIIGFSNKENYFYHLGFKDVRRSTLADANQNRNCKIYEELFNQLLPRCHDVSPKHKFKFKNKLESLDSTTIDLCLKVFPWAGFRQAKGGIKIHTKIDHSGHLPSFVNITDARTADINGAGVIKLEAGSILVVDRAYVKYLWLCKIDHQMAFWVTRLKTNMKYRIVKKPQHKLPQLSQQAREKGVIKDQVIRLTSQQASREMPIEIRLVTYRDPETGQLYEFITNIFHLAALTIAEIYKARWDIEKFFRWIKQNLKIKTFIGTSENAVRTQIWIAMITYLLLSYIKYKMKCQYSLLEIQRLLRENIFARISFNELFFPKVRINVKQRSSPPNPNQVCLRF